MSSLGAAIDREIVARNGLHQFVRKAWAQSDPSQFKDGWHIKVICAHLERLFTGQIKNLCIMVPPGTGKSLLTQVFFPAWAWTVNPREKLIYATYEANLGKKFARQQRALISSEWWLDRWPVSIGHRDDRSAGFFKNTHGGSRFTTGTGGALTGHHAGVLVGDDLIKAQSVLGGAAETQTIIEAGTDFWLRIMPTRQTDPATTRRVLIQQRLHHRDPAGQWLEHDPNVVVVCLPMRCEHNHPYYDPSIDKRAEGELLWPEHIPEQSVEALEKDLGPFHASAQLQQRPGASDGEVFKADWLEHTWTDLRTNRSVVGCISCDLTFGGKKDSNSYVAIGVWVLNGPKAMLIHQYRGQCSYTETRARIAQIANDYRMIRPIIIENKANGPAVLDDLKATIPGMVASEPSGSKLARAHSVSGYFAAGDVLLPAPGARVDGMPIDTSWVGAYKTELIRFRGSPADYDDQVDQTSQALAHLLKGRSNKFLQAMTAVRSGS